MVVLVTYRTILTHAWEAPTRKSPLCDLYPNKQIADVRRKLSTFSNKIYVLPYEMTSCNWAGIADVEGTQSWVVAENEASVS